MTPQDPPAVSAQPQLVVAPPRITSTLATLSLIFAILGLVVACCSFGVPSAAAVVLGHMALGETKDGRKGGHGMAVAGLVLGYLVVIPAVWLSIATVLGGLLGPPPPTP